MKKEYNSVIPIRFIIVILTSWAYFISASYVVILSVTIVAMVANKSANSTNSNSDDCLNERSINESLTNVRYVEVDWSAHYQGFVLSSYFLGSLSTQVLGGFLSERFGAKRVISIAIVGASFISLLQPSAARTHYIVFLFCRICQGMLCGMVQSSSNTLIARWMPPTERARTTSIIYNGALLGTCFTLIVSGVLSELLFLGGWPLVYYLVGVMGFVWCVFWLLLIYETPETHPYISQKEYEFILSCQGNEKVSEKPIVPWKSIFTSIPVYALIMAHIGFYWGLHTVLNLLPTYFHNILHLDIKSNGLVSSMPYILQSFVSLISSFISDKLRQRGKYSVTFIIKINNSIAYFGAALCLIGVTIAKCDATLSIIFFILAMGCNGCIYPGFKTNHVNLAPDFAGTIYGYCNTIGGLAAFCAPIVATSFSSKGQTVENWSHVFYLCAAIYVFTQIIYIIFGSAQLQPWAISHKPNNMKGQELKPID